MDDVQSQWEQGKCPDMNGILFASGKIAWINVSFNTLSGGRTIFRLEAPKLMHLSDLAREGDLRWVRLLPLDEVIEERRQIRVVCGEGGFGGDGFVAVTDLGNQLQWIAFFDCANPFESAELGDGEVVAKTNLRNTWRFPLDSPERVTVE